MLTVNIKEIAVQYVNPFPVIRHVDSYTYHDTSNNDLLCVSMEEDNLAWEIDWFSVAFLSKLTKVTPSIQIQKVH